MRFEKPFSEMEDHWLLYASSNSAVKGLGKAALGFKVYGTEFIPKEGRGLIAFNHRHWLDILLGPSAIPNRSVRMVAKKELFEDSEGFAKRLLKRLLSSLIEKWGAIPVDRDNPGASTTRQVLETLRAERLAGVMPEGHRYRMDELGELNPGVARWARLGDAPTIPGAIRGVDSVLGAIRYRSAVVLFGPPLDPPASRAEEPQFMIQLRGAIQDLHNQPVK